MLGGRFPDLCVGPSTKPAYSEQAVMVSNRLPSSVPSPVIYESVWEIDSDYSDWEDDISIVSSHISFHRRSISPASSSSSGGAAGGTKVVSLLTIALRREREMIAALAKRNAHHYQDDDQPIPAQSVEETFIVGEASDSSDDDESTEKQPALEVNQAADKKTSATQEPTSPHRFLPNTKCAIPTTIPPNPVLAPIQRSAPIPIPLTENQADQLRGYQNLHIDPHTAWLNVMNQIRRAGPLGLAKFDATTYFKRDGDWVCSGCSTANNRTVFSCWACKGSKGAWCEEVIPEVDGPVGFLVEAL